MRVYQLLDHDTYVVLFRTHDQFDEHFLSHDFSLPTSSFTSSSYSLNDPHGPSIHDHIEEHLDEQPTIEDPTPFVTLPKWACTTVEEVAPSIQDLPPSRYAHSTGIGLVCQLILSDLLSFLQVHVIQE